MVAAAGLRFGAPAMVAQPGRKARRPSVWLYHPFLPSFREVQELRHAVESYSAMGAYALRGFVLADLAEATVLAGDDETATSVTRWAQDNAAE